MPEKKVLTSLPLSVCVVDGLCGFVGGVGRLRVEPALSLLAEMVLPRLDQVVRTVALGLPRRLPRVPIRVEPTDQKTGEIAFR
jgi:hypothetical protein